MTNKKTLWILISLMLLLSTFLFYSPSPFSLRASQTNIESNHETKLGPHQIWTYKTVEGVRGTFITEDGRFVTIGGIGFVTRLDAETGQAIWTLEKPYQINTMDSTTDGSYTIVGLEQTSIWIIGEEGSIDWRIISEGPVISTSITTNGEKAIFGTFLGTLYFINPIHQQLSSLYRRGDAVIEVAISNDGTLAAAGFSDDSLEVFIWGIPEPLWHKGIDGHPKTILFSTDNDLILVGSSLGFLYAFNFDDGTLQWTFQANASINSIAFTDDGSRIAAGSNDEYVYLLEKTNGSILWAYKTDGMVKSVVSPKIGSILLIGGSDKKIRILDLTTGHELGNMTTRSWINHIASSKDASTIALGAGKTVYGATLTIETTTTSTEITKEFDNNNDQINIGYIIIIIVAIGLMSYLIIKRNVFRRISKLF